MNLKIGSKGDDVKKLQTFLGLTADGDFGNKTDLAVKNWQSKNGLPPDGLVGDAIWTKMGLNSETSSPVSSSGNLNLEKLKTHIPDSVLNEIPETAKKFGIKNNLQLAHFLAQCCHESGEFKVVSENLNYSADGLKNTFKKYFPGDLANSYAKQPEKIASRVYADRMGNGNEASKDGYKFRGRGYIQLTGKSNYTLFANMIGEDTVANPNLVADKYPLASAAFFFSSNRLWDICDKGATDDVVTSVTKKVNGGTNGLADRIKNFRTYYDLLK